MSTPRETLDEAIAVFSRKDTIDPKQTLALIQAVSAYVDAAGSSYTLPPATDTILGGVKIDVNGGLLVGVDGNLAINVGANLENSNGILQPVIYPVSGLTALFFSAEAVYGTVGVPETGNITADFSEGNQGRLGVRAIVIHNNGSEPTFSSEYKKLSTSGDYVTGQINYITCTYISDTEIIYSIAQRT